MRFSGRLKWDARANTISVAAAAARGQLLDLTVSNPTRVGLSYPHSEILEAISQPAVLGYEPEAAGLWAARQAVADYYSNSISASTVLLTSSTSEAYSYVFKLLCDPGDEVLVPRPSYPLFEMLAGLDSVRVRQYPIHYDRGWFVDVDEVSRIAGERTRAVIAVSPNNPTGSCLNEDEYLRLAQLCSARGLALVCDEVFADYRFDGVSRSLAGRAECPTFVLSGLSKVAALPQMKLGWVVAPAAAMERLEWIADSYLSPGAPVQYGTARLLASRYPVQNQIRERCLRNVEVLRAQSSFEVLELEGGWSAVIRVPRIRTEEEWVLGLIEKGVLVQPGYFYDFESEAYLILSLLTPEHVFAEGIARI